MSVTISPLSASTIVSSVMSLLPGNAILLPAAERAGQDVLRPVADPASSRPGLVRAVAVPAELNELGELAEAREELLDVAGVDHEGIAALDRGGDRRRLGAREGVELDRLADDVGVHVGLELPARLYARHCPATRLGVNDARCRLDIDVADEHRGKL